MIGAAARGRRTPGPTAADGLGAVARPVATAHVAQDDSCHRSPSPGHASARQGLTKFGDGSGGGLVEGAGGLAGEGALVAREGRLGRGRREVGVVLRAHQGGTSGLLRTEHFTDFVGPSARPGNRQSRFLGYTLIHHDRWIG
jgi:hypothetical protein